VLTKRPFCCRIVSKFDPDGLSANFVLITTALKGPIVNSIAEASANISEAFANNIKQVSDTMSEAVINAIKAAVGKISHANVRSNAITTGFNLIATGVRDAETTSAPRTATVLSAVPLVVEAACEPTGVTTLHHDPKYSLFP